MHDKPIIITIGITCYNAQDTIAAAIESALLQTWADKEIILVDDASDDNSPAIIRQYPAVHYIRLEENKGVAVARNEILRLAKGDFIAFFDDDDVSVPDRLAKQYRRIFSYEARHGQLPILCHSARRQIYPDGTSHYETTIGTREKAPAPRGEKIARRILLGRPFADGRGSLATCSQMARKETYMRLGGFDPAFRRAEDTDLALRHALQDGVFLGISEPLVCQTISLGSDKTIQEDFYGVRQLYDKHAAYMKKICDKGFSIAWLDTKQAVMQGRSKHSLLNFGKLFLKHPIKTIQKILWSLPNLAYNKKYKSFQAGNPS